MRLHCGERTFDHDGHDDDDDDEDHHDGHDDEDHDVDDDGHHDDCRRVRLTIIMVMLTIVI